MLVSLKTKNLTFLIPFLVTNMLLIRMLILSNGEIDPSILYNFYPINFTEIVTAPIIIFCCLLINALIPSNLKATIIFWRIDALPGHRAFSHCIFSDPRINLIALQNKLGRLPVNALYQNSLWYSLYKKHESNVMVKEAHQHFLLFRDAASMVLIMFIIFSISTIFYEINMNKFIFFILLIEYLTLMIASRNMGNGLVKNVLALESIIPENKGV